MKKQFAAIIVSIAAVLVLTVISANAQSTQMMTIDIPFEFNVAGKTYGAGKYTIGRFNPAEPGILILKKKDGGVKKIFLTQNVKSKTGVENARVVFSKAGGSYSLSEIWTGDTEGGLRTINSKNDRKAGQVLREKQEKVANTNFSLSKPERCAQSLLCKKRRSISAFVSVFCSPHSADRICLCSHRPTRNCLSGSTENIL